MPVKHEDRDSEAIRAAAIKIHRKQMAGLCMK